MSEKFVVQVVPLIPLPAGRMQAFSYWHDKVLPIGTLVSIPFYFREVQGVVVESGRLGSRQSSMKLKNIRSVVEENLLSVLQIELARKIADYYFAPLGLVLKLMIPRIVKPRRIKKKAFKNKKEIRKIGKIGSKILSARQNKFLLVGSVKEREEINVDLIYVCLKKNKQCLILVPEIFFSYGVYERLQKEFSEEIALIHSRVTKGQFYDWWKKIKAGEIRVVIASKQGIFLPFFDLGLIIVQEEQDVSFKQWETVPRYNAVRGAEFLSNLTGAKLVLESSTPSVENFWRIREGEFKSIDLEPNKNNFLKIKTVSLEKERENPDFPISKALYEYLVNVLKKNKQAVVFVNRRGFSTRTTCENCKKILKCPRCERTLIYSDESGLYRCLRCSYKMDLLSACPACGGFQFSHRGIGTQTVDKKLKKLFPSAAVVRVDADALRSPAKYQNVLRKFFAGEIDILVGTQSAIKGIYSENIELVAVISGQDFSGGAEFGSREIALLRLFQMVNLLNENGVVVIQSFFGDDSLFDIVDSQSLKNYYKQELAVRKRFLYPPFRKFVKLAYRGKSEKGAQSEAKKTFDLLRRAGDNEIEIIGPYESLSKPKSGLYQRNILVKIMPEKDVRDLLIWSMVGELRKGWSVDVDPVSLF